MSHDITERETKPSQLPLFTNSNIFHSYLISVKQLTNALSVSLFLNSKTIKGHEKFVFHEGEASPVSEFVTEEDASAFISKFHKKENGNPQGFLIYCKCSDSKEHILGISITDFVSVQNANGFNTKRRKVDSTTLDTKDHEYIWLSFRFETELLPPAFKSIIKSLELYPSAYELLNEQNSVIYTLALGGYMALQNFKFFYTLQDSVSKLPGRIELQACLKVMLEDALLNKQPLTLLFINPDEFNLINQRLDRKMGDQALAGIAKNLASSLRRSDLLFRYGGAIFTALLPQIDSYEARKIAEKLRQTLTGLSLIGDIRLSFSVGFTVFSIDDSDSEIIDESELLSRADQALNRAKLSGGGCVVEYTSSDYSISSGSFDRLSGIFTADTEKDYRNIQLLWETITVISSISETSSIASKFVERIAATFKLNTVNLFVGQQEDKKPRIIASAHYDNDLGINHSTGQFKLLDQQLNLVEKVKSTKRVERFINSKDSSKTKPAVLAYGFPLISRKNYMGCLYIDGIETTIKLDSSDLIFLNALASQIAVALDRAELALQWKQEKEREGQRLREEIRDLRQFMTYAKLVYRSVQMESILETVRKLAPTDITVLITGESGTGKEVLAQTLHECSDRKNKPLITVDCGAISQNLIESELFGHVKGAFTGAQVSSEGRIVQANEGTLFLDEIGELPLDVQAKLLRVVQEKQITPVGGTKTRLVDVRIIAATNRNLAEEVAKGRFRGDLYFRLNVVTIKSPALRERPDDILPLAIHFLEKFSIQYNKGNLRFSPEAENALLAYQWPGNVRELQNTIIRAVVLSNGEVINRENLQFSEKIYFSESSTVLTDQSARQDDLLVGGVRSLFNVTQPPSPETRSEETAINLESIEPWQHLRQTLATQVAEAVADSPYPVPLGKWLNEDLIYIANQETQGNARQAALLLALPETTFRRQIEKINALVQAGLLSRPSTWDALKSILNAIIKSIRIENQLDVLGKAQAILLEQVVAHVPKNHKKGAALMGVTGPTYRRLLDNLSQ